MTALRTSILPAVLLALICSLPPSAQAMGPQDTNNATLDGDQAKKNKQELREAIDEERAKAYQPSAPQAKPKKPQEIIIHTN